MGVAVECESCPHHAVTPAEIMADNRPALAVFQACRQQWRTGFNGATALDGAVVWRVIDELNPANKLDCYRRVEILAAYYLERLRKRNKR